jgi:hypothetical protein
VVARGADAITRLTKRDVEALLTAYDADPVAALTVALRRLLDRDDASWPELVGAAPLTDTRRAALLVGEQRALDGLAAELNEARSL